MSSIIDANLLCKSFVNQLSALNRRRWHSAFVTIYCSRAFEQALAARNSKVLLIPSQRATKKTTKISSLCDHVIINVKDYPNFYNTYQPSLTKLVKEKSIHQLNELGGVLGIATSLNTKIQHGLNFNDYEDISRRVEAFGSNTFRKPPKKGFFPFVWEAFQDPTISILLACAALSLGFGIKENGPKEGWYDGGSIFVAVFLVISVSAISNFRQNRQFERLSKISSNIPVEVVRNGKRQQISIFEIVVGDVVYLKTGDQVPADGLFLEGHSLRIDESSMTGESDHLEVNHSQNPFLISGTKVADGYGQMLVTSVGMNTTWGQMMSSVSHDFNEKTPLQSRLNKLTSAISKVGLAVAFLVLVVLLVRYFTGHTKDTYGNKEFNGSKTKADDVINAVVKIIAAAVTIVVVAIPEGLPLAVTLTLAYSMKRMMADQAMVRKLSACETMGSATTICTDKTGTLTLNRMTVTEFWLGKDSMDKDSYISISTNVLKLLHEAVSLNTTGSVFGSISSRTEGLKFSGSPTEKAILSWAVMELNMDMERIKQNCSILHVEAFNSDKKRSGVLMKRTADNLINVHWKGAAEMILAMCSHYYDAEGEVKLLDHLERKKFEEIIQCMGASSLRCIAFAYKQISETSDDIGEIQQSLEDKNLILLGIVGLKDPCRSSVKKAVEYCQYAGVKIKMITGDNVFTARAIATECGILKVNQEANEGLVVEGVEFRNYTDEERMEKVDKIVVMARSSPFDKHLMVNCLKAKGHVVAVTGDGTNDAPALKEADIGLSMGIQGTEVAKESSDIVILDDNFASVATVLTWGRCVYNNIQKFIQFQLTVNVAALVINFVAAFSAGEVSLTAVQLLWVNLIMDTLGALALATERPTKDLMHKPPVGRTEPLITNIMWRNLVSQALYQIAVLLTLQFRGESIFGVSKKVNNTLIFNTFVLCQVFNEFNARKLERKNVFEGIHRNKLFLGIIGVTIILQVVMVEFLQRFANTERLNWGQWGACIGIAAASWPIGWIVKCIPVPERPVFSYLMWKNLKGM
ncbi:putative calcium-transporting ATPase 13, plasma membrane-type [Coffea eugenioides]|uniref:putative calcium-transporting ATPase 13, plasma membrane-type n=1 Tax=Coffea eugenioides TaxID=49369 RepID=UPI000F60E7E4|nr:putative calcium-transporting ATPase 13, plasma membrane-type [Coffea eugenioides]XP_027172402.1 putative calcium-transporting ATPase 13, plasma membrane-type [Coffea eugenioides]